MCAGSNTQVFSGVSSAAEYIFTFKDVNILNSTKVGTLQGYRNALFLLHAHISCYDGWSFDGTFRSVVFDTTATVNPQTNYIFCEILSTATILSRLRAVMSNFIAPSSTTTFKINPGASFQSEGMQLVNCQFSGNGTYVDGFTQANNETWWTLNGNLRDTLCFAHIIAENSGNVTTISAPSTWYAANVYASGVPFSEVERFVIAQNRLTYTGAKSRTVLINGTVTVTGTSTDIIRIGVALDGNTSAGAIIYSKVTLAAGVNRYEVLPLTSHARLSTNNYIELYVMNETAGRNVTLTDVNVLVTEIGV
jgi:hypothetical protein